MRTGDLKTIYQAGKQVPVLTSSLSDSMGEFLYQKTCDRKSYGVSWLYSMRILV